MTVVKTIGDLVSLGDFIDIIHGYAFDGEGITDSVSDPVLVTPGNFMIGGGFKSDKSKHYHGPYPVTLSQIVTLYHSTIND